MVVMDICRGRDHALGDQAGDRAVSDGDIGGFFTRGDVVTEDQVSAHTIDGVNRLPINGLLYPPVMGVPRTELLPCSVIGCGEAAAGRVMERKGSDDYSQ